LVFNDLFISFLNLLGLDALFVRLSSFNKIFEVKKKKKKKPSCVSRNRDWQDSFNFIPFHVVQDNSSGVVCIELCKQYLVSFLLLFYLL
jgi:hypothetical protein